MRRRRRRKSPAVQAAEMAFAIPQVLAHRAARMADRKELYTMGAEKAAAATEAWTAMALEAMRVNQELALSAMQSFWWPWLGRKSTSRQLQRAASDILGAAMAPVHRRTVANAKRLGRPRRRRA